MKGSIKAKSRGSTSAFVKFRFIVISLLILMAISKSKAKFYIRFNDEESNNESKNSAETENESRQFPPHPYPTPPSISKRLEWHPPMVERKSKQYFPVVPEGTMRFSFLLRIPITFRTYLVPIATGRASEPSKDELVVLLNQLWDMLSSVIKNVEEVLLGQKHSPTF